MNNKTFWEAYAELGSKDFKTYAGISKLSDNELGYCFATNRAIAEKCKKHLTTVSTDINALIKKGYLFSIEIKDKKETIERRVYTAENFLGYQRDLKNIDNLIKTTYREIEGVFNYYNEIKLDPLSEKAKTPLSEKAKTPLSEKAKVIISNNNLSNIKSNQETSDSDLENKYKTKPSVIKMLAFDRNLLLDQKFINSLRIYDIDFLRELFAKVPKGTTNPAGYLMTCIKNNPQPKVTKVKKVEIKESIQVIEEPKEKLPRQEVIQNFCSETNCSETNMPLFLKNILNKTLEGLSYEQIS